MFRALRRPSAKPQLLRPNSATFKGSAFTIHTKAPYLFMRTLTCYAIAPASSSYISFFQTQAEARHPDLSGSLSMPQSRGYSSIMSLSFATYLYPTSGSWRSESVLDGLICCPPPLRALGVSSLTSPSTPTLVRNIDSFFRLWIDSDSLSLT